MADVSTADETGIPAFVDQLVVALQLAKQTDAVHHEQIARSSGRHGQHLFRLGVTIGEVVREYGDVCQVVTELASEDGYAISVEEFRVFNLCLDDAVAESVTAYARQNADEGTEKFGSLAHELRNLVSNAMMSFDIIKSGGVGVTGSTGNIHARSLLGLRNLVDSAISDVRLDGGFARIERMRAVEFVSDVVFSASLHALARQVTFVAATTGTDHSVGITGDRQVLASALSNLLQNAIKYTPKGGLVELTITRRDGRVLFSVADECGGLPPGDPNDLFHAFEQQGVDRSGLGLGLTIALKAARANGGNVHVRNIPGHGCVFTLDLPSTNPPSGLFELELPTPPTSTG